MAKDSSNYRRFGGKWVEPGKQFQDKRRGLRLVLSRFWYLLVPFVGVMCANSTYVRPELEDIKNAKNLERKEVLDLKDDIQSERAGIGTEIVNVETTIDTLYQPQIDLYSTIHDSLVAVRQIYDETLPRTRARIDSLQAIHDEIAADVEQLSETFRRRSSTLDSLEDWRAALADSIVRLDEVIAMRSDRLYRLRNPKDFERKEALFTGEGVYPRRDENPTREKGGN